MAERTAPKFGSISRPDDALARAQFLDDVNGQYSETSGELKVTDAAAINSMIENIIRTTPGERPFEPEFGSRFPNLLFEPCDDVTAYKMEAAIFDALNRWLPYVAVSIRETAVLPNPELAMFSVTIVYRLKVGSLRGTFQANFARG